MTATDYLDAIERRYLADACFVSALVFSPRTGVYVGTVRVLGGEELHRTATHAYPVDAARELARLAGVL